MTPCRPALWLALAACLAASSSPAGELAFERVVIDDNFPGAYQVEVADVNGDGKPDIVAVGGGTCAWYENPAWTKRLVSTPKNTPGIISSATRDIDGDGKAEVAIAYEFSMNEPKKGKLLIARQTKDKVKGDWTYEPIADVGSIHRLRWGNFLDLEQPNRSSDKPVYETRLGLAVAPIFGPSATPPLFNQERAIVTVYFPDSPSTPQRWHQMYAGDAPVLHAIDVLDFNGDGKSDIIGASNFGITKFTGIVVFSGAPTYRPIQLATGAPGDAPKRGSSEVHVGRLKDGRRLLATVEPWHGTDVAVYLTEPGEKDPTIFGPRQVIDTTLKDGHALWTADVDRDGDDEILAGFRGQGTSVVAYDYNAATKTWDRTVVDPKIAAQDLRGGDLDGDGTPDVVAVGGATHNVVWYRPKK